LAALVGLIVCTLGLAAAERPEPKTHTVTIEDLRFQPERLTVARGDTVVWVNKEVVPHTATSEDGRFRLQDNPAGEVLEIYCGKEGQVRLHLHVPSDDDGDTAGRMTSWIAACV
jgi:plastocyanin